MDDKAHARSAPAEGIRVTRRRRLRWGAAGAAAALLATTYMATSDRAGFLSEVSAQAPITWTAETSWPTSITLWRGDRYFVDLVNTLAAGEIEIQYQEGGTFSSSTEMFDTVQAGALQMGTDWPSYWEGRNTAFSLLTSVPMIFSPGDYILWYWQAGGLELAQELYGKYNLMWLPHSVTGPESGQRSSRAVRTGDDYAGLKMRQCGRNQSRILEDLGGSAIFMPGGEIYMALDRGTIDAGEFSVPEVDWAMGMQEVTEYWVTPGWHQPGPVSGLIINKNAWDELPDRVKFIFHEAAKGTMLWAWSFFEYSSGEYTQRFREAGTEITRLDEESLDRIQRATSQRILGDARENADHAKVAFSIYQYLMDIAEWRDIQSPFTWGGNPPDLAEVHAELKEIAEGHGVAEAALQARDRARERNKQQKFWQPGTSFSGNPVAQ